MIAWLARGRGLTVDRSERNCSPSRCRAGSVPGGPPSPRWLPRSPDLDLGIGKKISETKMSTMLLLGHAFLLSCELSFEGLSSTQLTFHLAKRLWSARPQKPLGPRIPPWTFAAQGPSKVAKHCRRINQIIPDGIQDTWSTRSSLRFCFWYSCQSHLLSERGTPRAVHPGLRRRASVPRLIAAVALQSQCAQVPQRVQNKGVCNNMWGSSVCP